jgi:hypothetical protein
MSRRGRSKENFPRISIFQLKFNRQPQQSAGKDKQMSKTETPRKFELSN